MCHSFVRVHCPVSLQQFIVLTYKTKCSFKQDRKPEKYPCGGPTLYNQRNCGKLRLYRKTKGYQSYLFLCEKNTIQIKMNLNQFLKSFIKGNFVRGQNKDCEICSNLFVCMYVWLIDIKTGKKSKCGLFQQTGTYVWYLTMAVLRKMTLLPLSDLSTVFFVKVLI